MKSFTIILLLTTCCQVAAAGDVKVAWWERLLAPGLAQVEAALREMPTLRQTGQAGHLNEP